MPLNPAVSADSALTLVRDGCGRGLRFSNRHQACVPIDGYGGGGGYYDPNAAAAAAAAATALGIAGVVIGGSGGGYRGGYGGGNYAAAVAADSAWAAVAVADSAWAAAAAVDRVSAPVAVAQTAARASPARRRTGRSRAPASGSAHIRDRRSPGSGTHGAIGS